MICNIMTLRDLFAGMAMSGLLASIPHEDADTIASWAYAQADEMLRERENRPLPPPNPTRP